MRDIIKNKIKIGLRFLIIRFLLVILTSFTRGDHTDVYSLWVERGAYLQEVERGTFVYNPEVDKALGIEIQNACDSRGKQSLSSCRLNMLYRMGLEYTEYQGF